MVLGFPFFDFRVKIFQPFSNNKFSNVTFAQMSKLQAPRFNAGKASRDGLPTGK
jgi:hypothetical protein